MRGSEEARERIIDRAVWRALETDRAYQNAENAEEQAERERVVTERVERTLYAKYNWQD